MLETLKKLENKIHQKNRELNNLHRRHKMNAQGNMRFEHGRINKNTYTNENYVKAVKNAIRIVYKERRPLFIAYGKAAAKYRENLGLPAMTTRGYPWAETVTFSRSKRRNEPLPSVPRLDYYYSKYRVGTGGGGGYRFHNSFVHVHPTKFFPNVQLMNALLKQKNLLEKQIETARALRGKVLPELAQRISNTAQNRTRTRRSPRRSVNLNIKKLFSP